MSDELRTTDVLGGAGACPEITWNGKTWKIGRPTVKARDFLELLAVAKAVEEIEKLRGVLSPPTYARREAALDAAIQGGQYATWEPGWRAVTGGASGERLMFLSLLHENHPDATEIDAAGLFRDRPLETKAAMLRVYPDFFRLLLDHPKVQEGQREPLLAQMTAELTKNLTPASPASASN